MEHKEEWERISFLNYKYKINQGWKIKNVNKKKNAHRQLIVRIVIKDPKRGTNDRSIFDYTTATQRRGRHENIFASNKCQPRHRTKRQNDNLLADMGQSISPRPSCFLIFHRSQPDGPLSSSARIYPSGGCKNSSPSFPRSSSTIVTRHPGESTMKKEEKCRNVRRVKYVYKYVTCKWRIWRYKFFCGRIKNRTKIPWNYRIERRNEILQNSMQINTFSF